ncbi:MAG: hypothetical protein R3C45_01880 [Phycisphaerales bacterium]
MPTSQPTPAAASDLKAVLSHKDLDEPMKLYLLLMINTGMQQADIANMVAGMYDATRGTLTRVRGKLAHTANAPTITYQLWPETVLLLNKHMQAGAGPKQRLLLDPDNRPLVKPTRGGGRIDRVRSAWLAFTDQLGAAAPTFKLKQIRKTGATLLSNQFNEIVANHYLGDAPSGILAKNYAPPAQARFDKAIAWLRKQVL